MNNIDYEIFNAHAKYVEWIDCEIVNSRIKKGWDFDKLCGWLIKNINNEDGFDFSYAQADELKELVKASNNYRIY